MPPQVSLAANPVIHYLNANKSVYPFACDSCHRDHDVTFAIVATHPDGVDKLAGGVIEDTSGLTYGLLKGVAGDGAYEMTLTIAQIHQLRPIYTNHEGTADGTGRVFRVRIFDVYGNEAHKDISVAFQSAVNGKDTICNGQTVDLQTDRNNCGACGRSVGTGSNVQCVAGQAGCSEGFDLCDDGNCIQLGTNEHCKACNDDCDQLKASAEAQFDEANSSVGNRYQASSFSAKCKDEGCDVSFRVRAIAASGRTCPIADNATCRKVCVDLAGMTSHHFTTYSGCWCQLSGSAAR